MTTVSWQYSYINQSKNFIVSEFRDKLIASSGEPVSNKTLASAKLLCSWCKAKT
jgi:hypothetical protein